MATKTKTKKKKSMYTPKYIYTVTAFHGIPTWAWPKEDRPKDEKKVQG